MATPKQLVEKLAELTGVAVNTVVQHDRNLADAGLRTVAGRGRAAARVTATDAAHLVIAVAASRSVKDSAATIAEYAGLEARETIELGGRRIGRTFADAVAFFIEALPHDREAFKDPRTGYLEIRLYGPLPRAEIRFMARGTALDLEYRARAPKKGAPGDLEFISKVTQVTIGHVGELVAN